MHKEADIKIQAYVHKILTKLKAWLLDNNLTQYKIIVLIMQCFLKIGLKQAC